MEWLGPHYCSVKNSLRNPWVDTIQERAADLLLAAGDGHRGTATFFHGVSVESAGAGVRVAVVSFI